MKLQQIAITYTSDIRFTDFLILIFTKNALQIQILSQTQSFGESSKSNNDNCRQDER